MFFIFCEALLAAKKDSQLAKIGDVFTDMKKYLAPVNKVVRLDFDLLDAFFK